MSNEELLKLAEQAGFKTNHRMVWVTDWEITPYLHRFAQFVADAKESQILDLLERLHEENWDRHNYYQYAINAIREGA